MDVVKIPPWWGSNQDTSRPNTVACSARLPPRTRSELLSQRKSSYKQECLPTTTILDEKEFNTLDNRIEIISAGLHPNSRDQRDRQTIETDFEGRQQNAVLQFHDEASGNAAKFSTLSALKQGRLAVEK